MKAAAWNDHGTLDVVDKPEHPVHPQIVADLTDNHLAGVEAHPDGEPEAVREAHLVRVASQLLLKVEHRATRTLRMILVRDRRAEERHDAVARVLVDGVLEAVEAVAEDRESR
jgi:hypothetical protein